jgi:hypothetical protein
MMLHTHPPRSLSTLVEPTSTSKIDQIISLLLAAKEKLQDAHLSNPQDLAVTHTNALVHLDLARTINDRTGQGGEPRTQYLAIAERDFRKTLEMFPEDCSVCTRV